MSQADEAAASQMPASHASVGASPLTPFTPSQGVSNLASLTDDALEAALDGDPGPAEPTNFQTLMSRLTAARDSLPPAYREHFYQPLMTTLGDMGPTRFALVLQQDPNRDNVAGLLLDAAQAILQHAEQYEPVASDAFQEVVSDLYDGFLSAESRRGVSPPDLGIHPPLVKWGNPGFGPYTWPVDATSSVLGLNAGVVSLPPANAHRGLLAWAALPHEAAGHDILHADTGLTAALASAVYDRLKSDVGLRSLATYWADRIDETASDVLGILNMGPTAGLGLIGYFRGLNAAWGGAPRLRNTGPAQDTHPADVLRGFLAAATVQQLEFEKHGDWAQLIEREVAQDLGAIVIEGRPVAPAKARASAEAVVDVLVHHRPAALEGHALGQIQNWKDVDEERVHRLAQGLLSGPLELPGDLVEGTYAAHLVAAAVVAGLTPGVDVRLIHSRMLHQLKQMHDANPVWSSLFVAYRGNAVRHRIYRPQRTAA